MKMETQLENKLRVNILLDANLCRDFLVEFQDELTLSFVSKVLLDDVMSISLAALTDASVEWLASLTGNLLGNNMIKSEKSSNKEAIIGKPSHQAPIHR